MKVEGSSAESESEGLIPDYSIDMKDLIGVKDLD